MNKNDIRDILDNIGVSTRKDADGDFYTILKADEDFGHDVAISHVLNETGGKLQMVAVAPEFKIDDSRRDEAVDFCNKWNTEKSFGCAYFQQGYFLIQAALNDPADLPPDYIGTSFFKFHTSVFWMFFKEAGKIFDR